MAYDVTVFGELRFPPGKIAAWKRMLVNPVDLPAVAQTFPRAPLTPPSYVSDILGELPRTGGRGLFQLREKGELTEVLGRLSAQAFESRKHQLCAMFLLAVEQGCEGDVQFIGEGVWLGYRVRLKGGKAKLDLLTHEEVSRATQHPALDAISEYFRIDPTYPATPSFDKQGAGARPMLSLRPIDENEDVDRLYYDAIWGDVESEQQAAMMRICLVCPKELGARALQALVLDPISWTNDREPRDGALQAVALLRLVKLLLALRHAVAMDRIVELWQAHPWACVRDGVALAVRESDPSVLVLLAGETQCGGKK
jgi:hypothetical protein